MTPAAQAILNDYAQPVAKRAFVDAPGGTVQRDLLQAHCFEVSAVHGLAMQLADRFFDDGTDGRLGFLPAERTVIEWRDPKFPRVRHGVVLDEEGPGECRMREFHLYPRELFALQPTRLALRRSGFSHWPEERREPIRHLFVTDADMLSLAFLALINSPRIIGRKQISPHAGLARKLSASMGKVGKYPLHATHEVLLQVNATKIEDGKPREAKLTGMMAQHHVRSHLRLVGGVVVRVGDERVVLGGHEVRVREHYRGNPILGMKPTRYRLEPPPP